MKASELRELSTKELYSRLKDEKSALQKLHFEKTIKGQVENSTEFGKSRRNVARILTVIKEKEIKL